MKRWLLAALLALAAGPALAQTGAQTTNKSVAITAGNTFQTVLAATDIVIRRTLTIENNNTNTDNCWIFLGSGTATKGTSILLIPGGSYTRYWPFVPSDQVQATCTTTGDTLYVDY